MDPHSLATLSDKDLLVKFYELQASWDNPIVTLTPQLTWYNTAGAVISTTSGTPVATSSSAWSVVSVTATPPGGAAYVLAKVEFVPADDAETLYEQCNTVGHVIESRFGPDSVDLLASYFTASHASANDAIWWAQNRTEVLVEIARDAHQCRIEPSGRCRCGAIVEATK